MKRKIALISGCSHTAGYEISGETDTKYNRKHSFGNVLARKLGYDPVNIAMGGNSNPSIVRSVMSWFTENYNPDTMEVFVIIGWTEGTRVDIPYTANPIDYSNPGADWYPMVNQHFFQVNLGLTPEILGQEAERQIASEILPVIAGYETYFEIVSLNSIIQLQCFLKSLDINYVMCNTMRAYGDDYHTNIHKQFLDTTRYMEWDKPEMAFYWYYRNQGFENPKAQYWHHNEGPHRLYAEKLYSFIQQTQA